MRRDIYGNIEDDHSVCGATNCLLMAILYTDQKLLTI